MSHVPQVFISTVTREFLDLRIELNRIVTKAGWHVVDQENLVRTGRETLRMLDDHIRECDCVVHLIGKDAGSPPAQESLDWLNEACSGFRTDARFAALRPFLHDPARTLPYTQWEAWLALLRGKDLIVVGLRDAEVVPAPSGDVQREHFERLQALERFRIAFIDDKEFTSELLITLNKLDRLLDASRFRWPVPIDFSEHLVPKSGQYVGRRWLFDRIDAWAAVPGKSLLLTGSFGIGKSAMVGKLLDHWSNRKVIRHFCRYNDDETLKPGRIVASMVAQLKDLVPEYRDAVEADERAKRFLMTAEENPSGALRHGVLDVLSKLEAGTQRTLYLLVDALDESLQIAFAPASTRLTLVHLVSEAAGLLPPWVRVLMTSRMVAGVDSEIVRDRFEIIDIEEMGKPHIEADITEYVAERAAVDHRITAFLRDANRTAADLGRALGSVLGTRFLLAESVLNDIANGHITADRADRLPVRMGQFYEESFNKRIDRAKLDIEHLRSVLAVVAVAREPLQEPCLGGITALSLDEVGRIVLAFSGLLVKDAHGGVTFAHFSLETWLRSTDPTFTHAGAFAIDPGEAEARLLAHCRRLVLDRIEPGAFTGYLSRFGVNLLVDRREFHAATRLLVALRDEHLGGLNPGQLRVQSDTVLAALEAHWRVVDASDGDERLKRRTPLAEIPTSQLRELLIGKDYETGINVPVIRILVECHPVQWRAVQGDLLDLKGENDLVFRHDCGVAYALAWHETQGAERESHIVGIEAMGRSDDPDEREIAGYAMKFICQRFDQRSWGGVIGPRIKPLVIEYAHRRTAMDRMVACEMLLALAIRGQKVDTWFSDDGFDVPFWDPYWPNQRSDVDAINTTLGRETPNATGAPDAARSLADARAQALYAKELQVRLLSAPYFTTSKAARRLREHIGNFREQQDDATLFDEANIREIGNALLGPYWETMVDFIRLRMLHPLWNMTERAATLVSRTIKNDVRLLPVIEKLPVADTSCWRLHYGAVDAAYNAGSQDDYATFFRVLIAFGRDRDCRVRGICIDDLNGWVVDAESDALDAKLADAGIVSLLHDWTHEADDVWLLEYLHLLFRHLHDVRKLAPATIESLLGPVERRSRFLGADAFYELDATSFMSDIEERRAREWAAQLRR